MLTYETIVLCSAELGDVSYVPDIKGEGAIPFFGEGEGFSKEMLPDLGKGMVASILPYTMQNRYDREIKEREYKAAILENEYLKAVFLPELGGRLWSLYNKKQGIDLVYENDALKFGNLALRNAWFAGGVEWNIGIKGHSPFTAGKMFTVFEKADDGRDVLKMYEYEEIRGLVYVMRFALDEDRLCVRITIENTKKEPTYMYWWSNIAVEQKDSTRVFVPTDKTFITSYRDGGYIVSHVDFPNINGCDRSYPVNSKVATDYFYDIPKDAKKWICSLDESGTGLLQYSSRNMQGRKMFVWGHAQGGDHWNKWLTDGRDYYEIQSGLAKTQFEHFLIDAGERISWSEVYTLATLKNNKYDGDYFKVEEEINAMVDEACLECSFFDNIAEEKNVQYGSGRGALQQLFTGERLTEQCDFPPESIGDGELYYKDLAQGVRGDNYGIVYLSGNKVAQLISERSDKSPIDYYLLGINRMICRDYDAAIMALENACQGQTEALANISLALYYANITGELDKAYEYAERVANDSDISIFISYCEVSIKAGRYEECANTILARDEMRGVGRIEMYLAKCLCEMGKLDRAESILRGDLVIPDIREGEYSLFNIYVDLYRKIIERDSGETELEDTEVLKRYPLPRELDFRLH